MSDNNSFSPDNQSVDDILQQVRQMRQKLELEKQVNESVESNQPNIPDATTSFIPPKVKPAKASTDTVQAPASSSTMVFTMPPAKKPIPEIVPVDDNDAQSGTADLLDIKKGVTKNRTAGADDKLDSFMSKTTDTGYKPDLEAAKRKLDKLFEEVETDKKQKVGLFGRTSRSAKVLSADEVLQSDDSPKVNVNGILGDKQKRSNALDASEVSLGADESDISAHAFQASAQTESEHETSGFSIVKPAESFVDTYEPEILPNKQDIFSTYVKLETEKLNISSKKTKPAVEINKAEPVQPIDSLSETEEELAKNGLSTESEEIVRKTTRKITIPDFEFSNDPYDKESNVIDDYRNFDDAESVKDYLEARLSNSNKRLIASIILLVLSTVVTILPWISSLGLSLPVRIDPQQHTLTYLIINALFLGIAISINIKQVAMGFLSLVRLRPDIDTIISVTALATAVNSVYAFGNSSEIGSGTYGLYSAIAILAMVMNNFGKCSTISRVRKNFQFVATNNVKQSCFVADDDSAALMAEDTSLGVPETVSCKSVINLQGYLKNSFCEDPADRISKFVTPAAFLLSVAMFLYVYYTHGDMAGAIMCFTAINCASVPCVSLLLTNLPLGRGARKAREHGGMISGYNAVSRFHNTQCVAIDAEELFPTGYVELVNLNAVGDAPIDSVIMDAVTLTSVSAGPLADVFDKMIEGKRKKLKPATNVHYEDGLGVIGCINGKTIKLGNRRMMENDMILNLPDPVLENNARRKNCYTVYLSCDGVLHGIFIVRYNADDDIANSLYRLCENGATLEIKTNDPNITTELIDELFDIPPEYVSILPAHAVEIFDKITVPQENGDAVLAHDNSMTAFAQSLVVCKRLHLSIVFGVILQTIFCLLGLGFTIAMSFISGYAGLMPTVIFSYQLICSLVLIIIPNLRKL